MTNQYEGLFYYKKDGSAFVRITGFDSQDSSLPEEVFIAPAATGGARVGDMVSVAVKSAPVKKSRRPLLADTTERLSKTVVAGKVQSIIKPLTDTVVGTVTTINGKKFLIPDHYIEHRIQLSSEKTVSVKDGDKVCGSLGRFKTPSSMRLTVKENLGSAKEFEPNVKGLLLSNNLDEPFSSAALLEAKQTTYTEISPYLTKRVDLRGKTTLTVTKNENSRTECAFSVERDKNGNYILGVHVADVAEFVPLDSQLDITACKRGKTVVLPDREIPMFPPALAHDSCFLGVGEDKLTISIFVTVTQTGKVVDFDFCESVINVATNCLYDELEALLLCADGSAILPLREKYSGVMNTLNDMFALGGILQSARVSFGSTDFDKANRKFIFGRHGGKPISIKAEKDSDPARLIREFISVVGYSLANYFDTNAVPTIYRVRPLPSKSALEDFRAFAASLGIETSLVSDEELFSCVTGESRGMPYEEILLSELLRILPATSFSCHPARHAIHGMDKYLRFAYPVNRYADLCVQRIIKSVIASRNDTAPLDRSLLWKYTRVGVFVASVSEIKALWVEDEISDLFALDYMKKSVGKKYNGTVWSVDAASVKVLLNNSCVGQILFDDANSTEWRQKFKVGTSIDAEVVGVDLEHRVLLLKA